MKPRLLRRALIFLYYVAFTLFLLVCSRAQLHAQAVSEQGAGASPRSAQADHQAQVDPLPPGCIHGTPAGEDPAVCCISGYVLSGAGCGSTLFRDLFWHLHRRHSRRSCSGVVIRGQVICHQ